MEGEKGKEKSRPVSKLHVTRSFAILPFILLGFSWKGRVGVVGCWRWWRPRVSERCFLLIGRVLRASGLAGLQKSCMKYPRAILSCAAGQGSESGVYGVRIVSMEMQR